MLFIVTQLLLHALVKEMIKLLHNIISFAIFVDLISNIYSLSTELPKGPKGGPGNVLYCDYKGGGGRLYSIVHIL